MWDCIVTERKATRLVLDATARHCRGKRYYIIEKKNTKTRTCSSRIAPGSTVTSATAILFEILKVVESTILAVPPLSFFGLTLDNG